MHQASDLSSLGSDATWRPKRQKVIYSGKYSPQGQICKLRLADVRDADFAKT
jgi:hypothetical protein